MSFKPTPLYGGAIIADLPASYGDASNLRQIPDHQEVWLDGEGYSSVVFEILERVEKDSDEEALQHHFADLVEGTGDSTNLLEQAKTELPKVPNHPLYSLSFIQTPSPTPTPRHKQPEYVAIHLLLLRLKEKATDIMISVNIPHYAGEYEKAAEGQPTQLMKDGEIITKKIIESFSIEDWGLFQG